MAASRPARPVPWPQAFGRRDPRALQSQAALLLLLGQQLRGDAPSLRARAAPLKRGSFLDALPASDTRAFRVPRLRFGGRPVRLERVVERLERRPVGMVSEPRFAELATKLRRTSTADSAIELLHSCLDHPDELPRVAAAASYFGLGPEPSRLLGILDRGTQSTDLLVRDVAATALARLAPEHPRLKELTTAPTRHGEAGESHTCLMIHGTFARTAPWWQPGGDFHGYLRGSIAPDLYAADDRFDWSGGYSDAARAVAAGDLRAWVDAHDLRGLDLFAHSHGGSVAMLASRVGMQVGRLVLLSCPVHVDKYVPDFGRVRRVVSIRVHLDLVILADGGGQRFRHPKIAEHVLPVWFDHSATRDPDVWRGHDVPAML